MRSESGEGGRDMKKVMRVGDHGREVTREGGSSYGYEGEEVTREEGKGREKSEGATPRTVQPSVARCPVAPVAAALSQSPRAAEQPVLGP